MSAGPTETAEFLEALSKLASSARDLTATKIGLSLLADDPKHRAIVEEMHRVYSTWHPALLTAAREVGKAKDATAKALRSKRWGLRA